jgi:hypothetical protein
MNRRTLISGLGLIALEQATTHLKAEHLAFAQDNSAFNTTMSSGNEIGLVPNEKHGADAFRLEWLPFLQDSEQTTHQFCSYDRAGDNYDFAYFPLYMETNGECVIFDAFGPGCLYRLHMNIWHDHEIYKGVAIRFYFDDEQSPRIDMDVSAFFSTDNPLGVFQSPLAYNGKNRFRMFYHPFSFKKRLKVCLSSEPGGGLSTVSEPWTGRYSDTPDPKHHWYEFTYQLFNENPPSLESWTPALGRGIMTSLVHSLESGLVGHDPKPAQGNRHSTKKRNLNAGQTATFWKHFRGAGSIAALRIKVSPANSEDALFKTWLQVTFDGAPSPQIEGPIGGIFGAYRTNLQSSYTALPLGFSNGAGYCYFPMPFWKSAEIQIENRGEEVVALAVEIDYKATPDYPERRCGYLHAHYHREDPRIEGKDYTYLETGGCGQVVGHVVMRWNTSMEEDERTYIDGSRTPWMIGEGFEDDHDMGWGLQNLTQPLFGAISAKGGAGGVYRFLLPDMYCFSSGIKYGHQTYGPHSPLGHEGMYQVGTEESVTFWYGFPHAQIVQTDEMDIGNVDSETTHAYHAEGDVQRVRGAYWYDGEFNDVLFKTPAIFDDGVSCTGTSTFIVSILPGNCGIRLRRRCDKSNNQQLARVFVDGRLVIERPWYSVDYEKTYRNIRWFDADFEIPEAYTQGKDRIKIRIEFVSSKTGRWDEYRYWVFSHVTQTEQR